MPDGSRRGSTTFKTGRHGSWAPVAFGPVGAARQDYPTNRTRRSAALAAELGRFCCKSRKMKGDENRHETRRDEKVLIKAIVARLRRSLVE
jgi:hypothetical protein